MLMTNLIWVSFQNIYFKTNSSITLRLHYDLLIPLKSISLLQDTQMKH